MQIIFKYLPASPNLEDCHTPPVSPSSLEGELITAPSRSYLEGELHDDDSIDMIFDILQLSRDLRKHAIIEDKILGPYVKQLEKSSRQ